MRGTVRKITLPRRLVTIATDDQFGPSHPETVTLPDLASFWNLHDTDSLRLNTLYWIG